MKSSRPAKEELAEAVLVRISRRAARPWRARSRRQVTFRSQRAQPPIGHVRRRQHSTPVQLGGSVPRRPDQRPVGRRLLQGLWYSTSCLLPLSLLCLHQPPASSVLESRMGALAAPTSLTSASPASPRARRRRERSPNTSAPLRLPHTGSGASPPP
jgi:hypothetical protein